MRVRLGMYELIIPGLVGESLEVINTGLTVQGLANGRYNRSFIFLDFDFKS